MDAGGDDPRARRKAARDPQAAFVLREIDLVQENRAREGIDHPNEILTILGEDGGRGRPEDGVLTVVQSRRNGGSKAKVLRRIGQRDANAAHARYGIGLRRYFANLALRL